VPIDRPYPAMALVWSADLKAGTLPTICVRTGRPAAASVKFRFVTAPGWAYALLLLLFTGIGFLVVAVIMRLVSRTASGRLPYETGSARRIKTWRWVTAGTMVAFLPLLILALTSLSWDPTLAAAVWILMLADFLATIALWYIVLPRLGPRGRVLPSRYSEGNWVELRGVHPGFAAAVGEMYRSRLEAVRALENFAPNAPHAHPPA
jgi:hypothetical protein